jgi:Tol biopolymer transport system component
MVGIFVASTACTVGGEAPASPSTTPFLRPAEPTPSPTLPPIASDLPGRLLVIGSDGGLLAARPDGSDVRVLAESDPEGGGVIQASWAPDGSRVAWSEVDGDGTTRIVTADDHGEARFETEVDVGAYYLSWDPTSSRVGYLGNVAPAEIQMGVVEAGRTNGGASTALASGAPFFFSWAPTGDRLLTHVDAERVDELTLDGDVERIVEDAAVFQAPVWSADGEVQVYATASKGERQSIVVRDARTGRTRTVAKVDGAVSLVLSPDGRSLAVQALNEYEQDLFDRDLPARADGVGVSVIDLVSGRVTSITKQPAIAFSWSPDGERLAVLEPMYQQTGQLFFRWVIWDGDEPIPTPPIAPGYAFLTQYAPFFSQFTQSMTLWSPDGSAFAYPADRGSEPTSIWIQPVDPAGLPYRLGAGSFVAWGAEPDG